MPVPGSPQVRLPLVALLAAACMAGLVHAPAQAAADVPADDNRALRRQLQGTHHSARRTARSDCRPQARIPDRGLPGRRCRGRTDRPIIASTAKAYSGAVSSSSSTAGSCV